MGVFLTPFWDCLCLGPQRFPAERQARRDGGGEAGQTGDAERNQRDHRSEGGGFRAFPLCLTAMRRQIWTLFSGDERPKAHGRSGGSEGASAGASERTGHADEHRALAADQSHAGTPPPAH